VAVSPTNPSIGIGSTVQLSATLRDASNNILTGRAVSWTTSNAAAVTVNSSSGLATGIAAGSATITATSEGRSNGTVVTVTSTPPPPPTITGITVAPASASLVFGQAQQFTATATLSNGSTQNNPPVTWTATGGTINTSGLFTAGSTAGTFRAIAAASGKADTATISIAAPPQGGLYPNRPSNYTNVTAEMDFGQAVPAGPPPSGVDRVVSGANKGRWAVIYDEAEMGGTGSNWSQMTDATAPLGGGVWRLRQGPPGPYGGGVLGQGPGFGFGNVFTTSVPGNANELYFSLRIKWDANYEYHPISTKFLWFSPGGILIQLHEGGNWLRPEILDAGYEWWGTPQVNTQPQWGVWHHIEVLIKRGNQGSIQIWMDGQLRSNFTNIRVPLANGAWADFNLTGHLGGGGMTKTRDSYYWIDHILIATPQ
jgi:hypothetical protein